MEARSRVGWLDIRRWPLVWKTFLGLLALLLAGIAVVAVVGAGAGTDQIHASVRARYGAMALGKMRSVADALGAQLGLLEGMAANLSLIEAVEAANAAYEAEASVDLSELEEAWEAAVEGDPLLGAVLDAELNPATAQLLRYRGQYPDVLDLMLTDAQGAVVAATFTPEAYVHFYTPWWQRAYAEGAGALHVEGPLRGPSGPRTMAMAVPLLEDGAVVGILYARMSLDPLVRALRVADVDRANPAPALIADEQGTVILATDAARLDTTVDLSWTSRDYILSQREHAHPAVDSDGGPVLLGHASMPFLVLSGDRAAALNALGWVLYVYRPLEAAYGPAGRVGVTVALTAIGAALALGLVGLAFARALALPVMHLADFVRRVAGGERDLVAWVYAHHEAGSIAQFLNDWLREHKALQQRLRDQENERQLEQQRRAQDVDAMVSLGDLVAMAQEMDTLLPQVVELIRTRWGMYFVGLYLVDEGRRYAVLHAGTGDAGVRLLARGHRVPVGQGMVGQAIAVGRARIEDPLGPETERLDADVLPYTRSEAILPLRSRGAIIGALAVESYQVNTFDAQIIVVLQSMADQLAVAIDSSRLAAAEREAARRLSRMTGELTRAAWTAMLGGRQGSGYEASPTGLRALDAAPPDAWRAALRQAWQETRTVVEAVDGQEDAEAEVHLACPIRARGEVIGVLDVSKLRARGAWSRLELEQIEGLAQQLGQALENARLYEETQARALEEQRVSDATRRMRETLSVDTVLQTAVQELRAMLDLETVEVRVGAAQTARTGVEHDG